MWWEKKDKEDSCDEEYENNEDVCVNCILLEKQILNWRRKYSEVLHILGETVNAAEKYQALFNSLSASVTSTVAYIEQIDTVS